jgi:hypothetical protein
MFLENTTDDNIFIAAGIFVPARSTLTVEMDMIAAVESSPLIADYVQSGALVLHKAAPVAEVQPAANPAPSRKGTESS